MKVSPRGPISQKLATVLETTKSAGVGDDIKKKEKKEVKCIRKKKKSNAKLPKIHAKVIWHSVLKLSFNVANMQSL